MDKEGLIQPIKDLIYSDNREDNLLGVRLIYKNFRFEDINKNFSKGYIHGDKKRRSKVFTVKGKDIDDTYVIFVFGFVSTYASRRIIYDEDYEI